MNTSNIIALFKELSDGDKAYIIAILNEEMPKPPITFIKTNQDAYNKRVDNEVAKCVKYCSELANKGVCKTYYTMASDIRTDVMTKLEKYGIYRMSLSKITICGDEAEVRLIWE